MPAGSWPLRSVGAKKDNSYEMLLLVPTLPPRTFSRRLGECCGVIPSSQYNAECGGDLLYSFWLTILNPWCLVLHSGKQFSKMAFNVLNRRLWALVLAHDHLPTSPSILDHDISHAIPQLSRCTCAPCAGIQCKRGPI